MTTYFRVGRTYALRNRLRAVLLSGICGEGGALTGAVALLWLVEVVSALVLAGELSELEA